MTEQLSPLDISHDEMRSIVLETLDHRKNTPAADMQVGPLSEWIATIAAKRHFKIDPVKEPDRWNEFWRTTYVLDPHDIVRVQDVLWDLIVEGIIRPGYALLPASTWPHIHLTDKGRERVQVRDFSPYDPDGYFGRLSKAMPDLDEVVVTYLRECLVTFRAGCFLSSTVTLGCASERAFLLLVDAYADSLDEEKKIQFKRDTDGRPIKRVRDEFMRGFDGRVRPRLSGDLKDHLDVTLDGVFTLLRTMRNEAGHPTGRSCPEEEIHASIILFPTYLKKIYALIAHLKSP
ncbi:hypothetical protein [Paludisphaera mucosa]|uniref:DUF4145 domain-containing protein n=1 Tax=Paludisphaera mucosa TaxID=3030827 RepID=A0ABT6F4Y3_9BACT|nr:hypothetical protein [Paludisphaera mucosa]MDG3002579.1 hypothetical protein [Paludisphaera mucosa]